VKAKLPVGIIGLGRMGQLYAKHFAATPETDIVFVSDIVEDHTKEFATQNGAKKWSANY